MKDKADKGKGSRIGRHVSYQSGRNCGRPTQYNRELFWQSVVFSGLSLLRCCLLDGGKSDKERIDYVFVFQRLRKISRYFIRTEVTGLHQTLSSFFRRQKTSVI